MRLQIMNHSGYSYGTWYVRDIRDAADKIAHYNAIAAAFRLPLIDTVTLTEISTAAYSLDVVA